MRLLRHIHTRSRAREEKAVDPSSTRQVVDALIDADKDFDFAMVPGADHGIGGEWGVRKRNDFFVRHILGVDPPNWNVAVDVADEGTR